MEIINLKTGNNFLQRKGRFSGAFFSINKHYISFSKEASRKFNISGGDKIYFVQDLDRLYFYIDNGDEFAIPIYRNKNTLRIYSMKLVMTFMDRFPNIRNNELRFPMRQLSSELAGHKLVEIQLDKKFKLAHTD